MISFCSIIVSVGRNHRIGAPYLSCRSVIASKGEMRRHHNWPIYLVFDFRGEDTTIQRLAEICRHKNGIHSNLTMEEMKTNVLPIGGGVGSLHSRSRQLATLNLPEHSSATASFLGRLSSSLPVLVFISNWIFFTCQNRNTVRMTYVKISWSFTTKVTCTVRVSNPGRPILSTYWSNRTACITN
jgi:hypothetical protein